MQIWTAKLTDNSGKVIKGEHPVIIVSNWKQLTKKNETITIIPITSTLDNFRKDSHVEIEGYGLEHKSKILCNQVITIDRDLLLYKIGEITDKNKIKEIESV